MFKAWILGLGGHRGGMLRDTAHCVQSQALEFKSREKLLNPKKITEKPLDVKENHGPRNKNGQVH